MPAPSPPISLRLPQATREKLDRAATKLHRSRSFLMQEALERHLDAIIREDIPHTSKRHLDTLLSLGGAGKNPDAPRTDLEVQTYTNWLRGDEQDNGKL